jgi:hypothetical protein
MQFHLIGAGLHTLIHDIGAWVQHVIKRFDLTSARRKQRRLFHLIYPRDRILRRDVGTKHAFENPANDPDSF